MITSISLDTSSVYSTSPQGIADKGRNFLDNNDFILNPGHEIMPALTHLACATVAIMGIGTHLHLLSLDSNHASSSGQ
jgi:hypothetical protein